MRVKNWQSILAAIVKDRSLTPFEWGVNDCCIFTADVVLALTGVDHAADVRGTYTTEKKALTLIAAHGGLDALGGRVGPEIDVNFAQRGDVVKVSNADRELLSICMGEYCLAPHDNGLLPVPMTAALKAWRVG